MILTVLGRQPSVGLAELEALYGATAVHDTKSGVAIVDSTVDLTRLGGTVKTAELLKTVNSTDIRRAFGECEKALRHISPTLPEGKVRLGLSVYGLEVPLGRLNAAGLTLKKMLRKLGHSVRVVPNTDATLSSAQTVHNQLAGEQGVEFIIVQDGDSLHIGRVNGVQHLADYTKRDRERPKRDAFVGMLPPKLAQIIINLAVGGQTEISNVLDPFCGTGVLLQEAALMGYDVYGTDISGRMIDYSKQNLEWLSKEYEKVIIPTLEIADATDHTWKQPIGIVACEGFLGTPLSCEPSLEKLESVIHDANTIMKKFLVNMSVQLPSGTRLCVATPTWFAHRSVRHLPALDDLKNLGYNRIDFEHADMTDLIYHREDQIVGRELVVLRKE